MIYSTLIFQAGLSVSIEEDYIGWPCFLGDFGCLTRYCKEKNFGPRIEVKSCEHYKWGEKGKPFNKCATFSCSDVLKSEEEGVFQSYGKYGSGLF